MKFLSLITVITFYCLVSAANEQSQDNQKHQQDLKVILQDVHMQQE